MLNHHPFLPHWTKPDYKISILYLSSHPPTFLRCKMYGLSLVQTPQKKYLDNDAAFFLGAFQVKPRGAYFMKRCSFFFLRKRDRL